ncbi:hypothetical protein FB451DRAFT_1395462 [Mycena latifolia]|nr:hypothetical protein FB451DRAFT_1395462 [Mycena latifolia]
MSPSRHAIALHRLRPKPKLSPSSTVCERIAAQAMVLQSRGMWQVLKVLFRSVHRRFASQIACAQVILDTRIFNQFQRHLNSLGLSFQLFRNDLLRVQADRLEFWIIDLLIADAFWLSARQLSILIVSAAHGINFTAHAAPAVPIRLPLAALRDVGLPIPTILLALSYPSNPLCHRRYASPEAAVADCLLFIEWYEHNLCWLAECLRRIISHGTHTVWDFATALDISSKDEFFNLIANSRKEAGLDELDILFSTIEEAPFTFNDLDFGEHSRYSYSVPLVNWTVADIAEIIRPWYTHLGIVGDSANVGIGLYPIESEFASPMDLFMSQGFGDTKLTTFYAR